MDREEALEKLRKLYAKKGQLHSDEEGRAWLEQVSGLLHSIGPERAREFDNLSLIILSPVSEQTMRPAWHMMGTVVQAAIIEAEPDVGSAKADTDAGSPTDPQQKLLQFVYDHLVQTGEWPPTRLVRVEMRREGRLEDLCSRLGNDRIICNFGGGPGDTCALRLGALPLVEGAEVDRDNILRGLAHLVSRYINAEGEARASYHDFVSVLGMSEAEAGRAAEFLRYSGIWSQYQSSDADSLGHGLLSHEVLDFEDVGSLDDVLDRLRLRTALPGHEQPQPAAVPSSKSLDAAGSHSTGFWDQYGRPVTIAVVATVIGALLVALLL